MLRSTVKAILIYVGFFWGIAWRSFALAITTAVLVGIGLSYVAREQSWPPEMFNEMAGLSGLPITLLVLAFVIWKQGLALKNRLVESTA